MSLIYTTLGILSQMASQIVVSALNPIHRVGYQVVVFLIGAFLFMLLDFYFQGQVYIIVYVGAIAIQFQFIIMMVECNTTTDRNSRNNESINKKEKLGQTIIQTTSKNNIATLDKETESIGNDSNRIPKNLFQSIGLLILLFQMIIFTQIILENEVSIFSMVPFRDSLMQGYTISAYFYPVWAIEFISMTDLETQGIMAYVAYPAAQIQIGLTLWAVMIGIISICSPRHR